MKQGDLENLIMNALWQQPPVSDAQVDSVEGLADVQDIQNWINQSDRQWAYTTVKTVLDRLVDKDLVTRRKRGKKFYYGATIGRNEAGLLALEKLLRQYYQNNLDQLKQALNVLEAPDATESVVSLLQASAQSGKGKAANTKTLDPQTKPLKKTAV